MHNNGIMTKTRKLRTMHKRQDCIGHVSEWKEKLRERDTEHTAPGHGRMWLAAPVSPAAG